MRSGLVHLRLWIVGMSLAGLVASQAAGLASDDGIIVERDEVAGSTTVIVPARNGRVSPDDVARGLALAGGLDADQIGRDFDVSRLDLRRRESRAAVRLLSAAIPNIRLDVIDHPATGEAALEIRIDRFDARQRLRYAKGLLREKLGGEPEGCGLVLDEGWEEKPADRAVVVLVHGYGATRRTLEGLHDVLAGRDWPCGTFAYPNDGPLKESAKLLAKELRGFRRQHPERRVAIVAHSMGGLIARAAIEDPGLDPGNVEELVMVSTPNHGTRWAELPGGLDYLEHLPPDPEKNLMAIFRGAVADGLNEARDDLKPDSRFLRELNSRPRNGEVRYSLILGTGGPCTAEGLAAIRQRVTRRLNESRTGRLVLPKVDELLGDLDEWENGKGDGVVAVERAKLDGVDDTLLLPIGHHTLSHGLSDPLYPAVRDAVVERVER